MLVDDLALYGAFAGGWLVGRVVRPRGPWLPNATLATVVVLVTLLGASFRGTSWGELGSVLPDAALLVASVLAATVGCFAVLRRALEQAPERAPAVRAPAPRFPSSALILVALVGGYGLGRSVALPTTELITASLVVLLALIGLGIELAWTSVRRAWLPIASSFAGALLGASVTSLAVRLSWSASLATSLGFGWYSLAGPLVAARLGAAMGLLAFLVNFVREAFTMILAPSLGRRLRGEGLAALGGATAMDTTLYFVVRHGDRDAGPLALASGLTLTIAASLLVPLVLAV
ncbi:MAG TPA: lysine exporter LysO family protein [Thermoplasmata archaeon]|nr:lysine exporter LysO family protein [Thermoplasmata archaeon]